MLLHGKHHSPGNTASFQGSHACAEKESLARFSLVLRPSLPPVFDRLQYANMDNRKLEPGKAWE